MKQIIEYLNQEIGSQACAIMCGHYPLVVDNGKVAPGLHQSIIDEKLRSDLKYYPYASEFGLESFLFGVSLLKSNPEHKLVSLVNDWQMIPKNEEGNLGPNPYRAMYYESAGAPGIYSEALRQEGFGEDVFLEVPETYRTSGNKIHFSETRFRNIFRNQFKPEACGLTHACAQEFVPFLQAMAQAGVRVLIACIPPSCKEPTLAGIRYSLTKLKLDIEIWSVYPNNTTDVETFWDQTWIFKNGEYETVTE